MLKILVKFERLNVLTIPQSLFSVVIHVMAATLPIRGVNEITVPNNLGNIGVSI